MKKNSYFSVMVIAIALFTTTNLCQAQTTAAKNVIVAHRVFPKIDHVPEFEKALANHAQKFHSGDNQWRVFVIESGPDFGGFQINEGPKSWESEDTRGDLGAEHKLDWSKNVTIHLTERQSLLYAVYNDSLSTVALGDYSDKINITRVYPKIGHEDDVVNMIKKLKKDWVSAGVTVAVYAASSSGKTQYILTTRYKQGLKEKARGFRKPFKETHEAMNGDGSYAQFNKDLAEFVNDETWSELLSFRKDLSSK